MTTFFNRIRPVPLSLLMVLWMFSLVSAQDKIEKKIDNGDDSSKYVWVIIGDGYTDVEAGKFQSDTSALIEGIFSAPPYKEYKSAINVYTIFRPSEDSGADHPSSGIYVDTVLDATFDTYGMARLLTVNASEAFTVASQVPYYDIVFVLVNDGQYGGSGGSVIAVSTNQSSIEIALHESGHVIGGLADEYDTEYPGYPAGDSEPNVTCQYERGSVPWKEWIDPAVPVPTPEGLYPDTIGLFEGARYLSEGIYRPKEKCRMRSLNKPFCDICRQSIILEIYRTVSPVESFIPGETEVELNCGHEITFSAQTLKLDGGSYEFLWEIDDSIFDDEFSEKLKLYPSAVTEGRHSINVWVRDSTGMVRTDDGDLMTSHHVWTIDKLFCSGKLSVTITDANNNESVRGAELLIAGSDEAPGVNETGDGKYLIPDVPCGSHALSVQAAGFKYTEKMFMIEDAAESSLFIMLDPEDGSYYISGRIEGSVFGDVKLKVTGDESISVTIGSDGDFIIGPLETGEYVLTPEMAGYRFVPRSQKVSITGGNVSSMIFTAQKTGLLFIIGGIIQGGIKEGVIVAVSGPQKDYQAVTDEDGRFRIDGLSPGKYKVTPVFSGVSFQPPEMDVSLMEEDIKEVEFFAKKVPCPATRLLSQNPADLRVLRQFRDNILNLSKKGRGYVRFYYLAGGEVSMILEKNKKLAEEARSVLLLCMPCIEEVLDGGDFKLPPSAVLGVKNFARHLAAHGSPLLKKITGRFMEDFEKGQLF